MFKDSRVQREQDTGLRMKRADCICLREAVVKFLAGTGEKAHRDKEQVHACAGQRRREETRPLPVHRVRARRSLTSAYTFGFFMALKFVPACHLFVRCPLSSNSPRKACPWLRVGRTLRLQEVEGNSDEDVEE